MRVGALSGGIANWGSGAMWGCEVECWGLNGNEFASVGVCAVCGRFCLDLCGLRAVGILFFVHKHKGEDGFALSRFLGDIPLPIENPPIEIGIKWGG